MSKLQSIAAIATIIGVIIAAINLIPAFGQWLALRVPTSEANQTTRLTQAANLNYDKSTFAVLVGVTDKTAFNTSDAVNYLYMASVSSVDDAIVELSKVFTLDDIIYVVHVPNLRITPGNPGSCKLYLRQVEMLKEYPLGWIIGGDTIVPNQFESGLQFCYGH